jgi:hypothetical protein
MYLTRLLDGDEVERIDRRQQLGERLVAQGGPRPAENERIASHRTSPNLKLGMHVASSKTTGVSLSRGS